MGGGEPFQSQEVGQVRQVRVLDLHPASERGLFRSWSLRRNQKHIVIPRSLAKSGLSSKSFTGTDASGGGVRFCWRTFS